MARYTIIAAIDEEGGIGKDGVIPWDYPADRKFFRDTTMGHTVVVGRKTKLKLPFLPKRNMIVLSRKVPYRCVDIFPSVESVIEERKDLDEEVFIIGGAEIYAVFMPHVTRMLITRIPGKHGCDTFFPELDSDKFKAYRFKNLENGAFVDQLVSQQRRIDCEIARKRDKSASHELGDRFYWRESIEKPGKAIYLCKGPGFCSNPNECPGGLKCSWNLACISLFSVKLGCKLSHAKSLVSAGICDSDTVFRCDERILSMIPGIGPKFMNALRRSKQVLGICGNFGQPAKGEKE